MSTSTTTYQRPSIYKQRGPLKSRTPRVEVDKYHRRQTVDAELVWESGMGNKITPADVVDRVIKFTGYKPEEYEIAYMFKRAKIEEGHGRDERNELVNDKYRRLLDALADHPDQSPAELGAKVLVLDSPELIWDGTPVDVEWCNILSFLYLCGWRQEDFDDKVRHRSKIIAELKLLFPDLYILYYRDRDTGVVTLSAEERQG